MLDALDSILVRAIKGVFWFPLVFLPKLVLRSFPPIFKLVRIGILFGLWDLMVFGPLALLGEVDDPVPAFAIVCWSALAMVGSIVGVLKMGQPAQVPAPARPAKTADYSEAFV